MKTDLDHYDKAIILFLGHVGESTTNVIAEELEISWATTQKHLQRLGSRGYVILRRVGKQLLWKLNR